MNNNGFEYKGIFYKESNEKRYFEGGAHFKYKHLYAILSQLQKLQNETTSSSFPKNLSQSNSMPSISCNIPSSQKKLTKIKLKKDTQHLNSSLPLSKEIKYQKIPLPPTIKSRNSGILLNNNNHNISQPYSFNNKHNSSLPKNKNNSFIGISINKKQYNDINYNEQNSRNWNVPIGMSYCNANGNNCSSFISNNKLEQMKKYEKDGFGSLNANVHNVLYLNNSRNGNGIEMVGNGVLDLKKIITFKRSNNSFRGINNKAIHHILSTNKKYDILHNKYYKNVLMLQNK